MLASGPTVRDGSEAVKAKVSKKLAKLNLPRQFRNHAAKRASDLASPKLVAKSVGPAMCRKLPKKMLDMGLTVEVEEVFREGAIPDLAEGSLPHWELAKKYDIIDFYVVVSRKYINLK